MLSAIKAYAVRVYKTVVPSKTDEGILATDLRFSEANEPPVPFHTSNCDLKRE
jgi:hypothetical protein